MKNKTKIFIGIGLATIVVLIAVLFFTATDKNPVKDTKWYGMDGSVLTLSDTYLWSKENDTASGTYKVYTGKKASKFLDEYIKKTVDEMGDAISEEEKWGFEDEANKFKKQIESNSVKDDDGKKIKTDDIFILEEKLEYTTVNNTAVTPTNNVYFAYTTSEDGSKYLTFVNVRNYKSMIFSDQKPKDDETPQNVDIVDTNMTSDEHIPFTYSIPNGFAKVMSEDFGVIYAKVNDISDNTATYTAKDSFDVTISIMADTPVKGIIDEYPNAEEFKDGYKATQQMGPVITYSYLFEKDGTTYLVSTTDEETFNGVVESIKE